jgi:hypothetical protein
MVLVSDPFEDQFSCNDDLERKTRNVIGQFAARRCRQLGLATHVPLSKITYDDVEMVSRERYYHPRTTSVGEMLVGYQLTVMDDAFQAKLDQRITDAMVQRRLTKTGVVSGGVLLGVTFLFGVFRFAARKSPDPLRIG